MARESPEAVGWTVGLGSWLEYEKLRDGSLRERLKGRVVSVE